MKSIIIIIIIILFLVLEQWWNEIDRGRLKYSQENLSQRHCVHHKSHVGSPGTESGPPRWEAGG
jgi:hypothetical protein